MDAAQFWNRHATGYSQKPIEDLESYEHKLEKTGEFLTPHSVVLEFGCGTGGTALHHARNVRHVTALDISSKMIEFARSKAHTAGTRNVKFIHADLFQLDATPASFDMILGLSVMHLIQERGPTFHRIRSLLKPGGFFVTSTVCVGEVAPMMRYVAPLGSAVGLLPQLAVFKKSQWIEEVEREGFSIEYKFCPPTGSGTCFLIARLPKNPS